MKRAINVIWWISWNPPDLVWMFSGQRQKFCLKGSRRLILKFSSARISLGCLLQQTHSWWSRGLTMGIFTAKFYFRQKLKCMNKISSKFWKYSKAVKPTHPQGILCWWPTYLGIEAGASYSILRDFSCHSRATQLTSSREFQVLDATTPRGKSRWMQAATHKKQANPRESEKVVQGQCQSSSPALHRYSMHPLAPGPWAPSPAICKCFFTVKKVPEQDWKQTISENLFTHRVAPEFSRSNTQQQVI
jgi:hypothetical protein